MRITHQVQPQGPNLVVGVGGAARPAPQQPARELTYLSLYGRDFDNEHVFFLVMVYFLVALMPGVLAFTLTPDGRPFAFGLCAFGLLTAGLLLLLRTVVVKVTVAPERLDDGKLTRIKRSLYVSCCWGLHQFLGIPGLAVFLLLLASLLTCTAVLSPAGHSKAAGSAVPAVSAATQFRQATRQAGLWEKTQHARTGKYANASAALQRKLAATLRRNEDDPLVLLRAVNNGQTWMLSSTPVSQVKRPDGQVVWDVSQAKVAVHDYGQPAPRARSLAAKDRSGSAVSRGK